MNRVDSAFREACNGDIKTNTEQTEKESNKMELPSHIGSKGPSPERSTKGRPIPNKSHSSLSQNNSSKSHRQSSSTRRLSINSSSQSTTQTHKRHPGSKPSSHRTSATAVDPNRPARHYRVKSSQTASTASRDIDDVLALHFRSCSLFHNPSYSRPHPSISGHGQYGTDTHSPHYGPTPTPTPQLTTSADATVGQHSSTQDEEKLNTEERSGTVMHWTSSSRRRKEYEEIDRSNSGVRCLIRRITPRCVSGPPPQRFYEEDKDDDTCSVRRYRMDLPESDHEDVEEEKSTSSLHKHKEKKAKDDSKKSKKFWSCF